MMRNSTKPIFDVIILGMSLNGKYALSEINKSNPDLKVGIVDSKDVLNELISKTEITSNINYSGHKKRNSINSDKYERWGGALMFWPESQTLNTTKNLFDINNKEFNRYENQVLSSFGLQEKWMKKVKTRKLPNDYIVNRAFVTKNLTLNNLKTSAKIFNDIIIFKLLDKKSYQVLIGYDFANKRDIELKSKKIILAAGNIENTRILLNSPKLRSKNLGKNLGDHVNTDIYKFSTSKELPEDLVRFFDSDDQFWPRIQNINRFSGHETSFFGHISETRKYKYNKFNQLLKNKKISHYKFSLFYEKKGGKDNYISSANPTDGILPININFNLSDKDIIEYTSLKNNLFNFFTENFKIENDNFNKNFKASDFTDTLHPSGCTIYNKNPRESVVSRNGNLNINKNIIVLGTSNFPRPFSIHPTLASLALTKKYILDNF